MGSNFGTQEGWGTRNSVGILVDGDVRELGRCSKG